MDFINRGLSSLLISALVFIVIAFVLNIFPVILLLGAGAWGVSYIVKAFKSWNKDRKRIFKGKSSKFEKVEVMEKDFSESFNTENAIDVEYTEIK